MATQNGRTRDSQRSKVYEAEGCILDKRILNGSVPEHGRVFDSIHEVRDYVNALLDEAWWKRRSLVATVTVGDGRGHRRAVSYDGHIEIPRWARTEGVVLHEMAHEMSNYPRPWLLGTDSTWDDAWRLWADDRDLAAKRSTWPRKFGTYAGFAGHGRLFARCFLDLVQHKIGKEAHDLLRDSFREHNVKFTRRRPPMSEEQRRAASLRLAAARAKQAG